MGNFSGLSPEWVSKDRAGGNPAYPDQQNVELNLSKNLDTELELFKKWRLFESGVYPSGTEFTDQEKAAFNRMGRPFIVAVCTAKVGGEDFVPQGEQGIVEVFSDGTFNANGVKVKDRDTGDEVNFSVNGYKAEVNFGGIYAELRGISGIDMLTNWVENGTLDWDTSDSHSKFESIIPYYVGTQDSVTIGGHKKGLISGGIELGSTDNFVIPRVRVYSCKSHTPGEVVSTPCDIFEEVYDSAEIDVRSGNIMVRTNENSPMYLVVVY